MNRLFFLILIIFSAPSLLFAQPETELERRNGFKDLKLGMHVDSVTGIKFKKDIRVKDEFDGKLYEVDNPNYENIGEVDVKNVEVKAYKDLIFEITVVAEKDPRLMKALESIYGQAEYDIRAETWFWRGKDQSLKFRSHSKNSLEMVYESFPIYKLMKDDKNKKVEAIADDF